MFKKVDNKKYFKTLYYDKFQTATKSVWHYLVYRLVNKLNFAYHLGRYDLRCEMHVRKVPRQCVCCYLVRKNHNKMCMNLIKSYNKFMTYIIGDYYN